GVNLDGMLALDPAGDPRDRDHFAEPVRRLTWLVEVDAVERGREMVGVALARLLAVGHDVETGALLVAHRQDGRIVLRGLAMLPVDKPQVFGAQPHYRFDELVAVDQPVRLRVGSDQAGRKQDRLGHRLSFRHRRGLSQSGSRGARCCRINTLATISRWEGASRRNHLTAVGLGCGSVNTPDRRMTMRALVAAAVLTSA